MSAAPTLMPNHIASRDTATPDVSVIVVSFNTREVLRQCLQSAVDESVGLSAEILVVDNASSDGSPEMVEADFPQVTLLRSNVNLGFGEGNNVALRQARGRYFVLLNSDAFFVAGALRLAIQHMEEHPECGLGGARLIGRDGALQPSARSFHTVLGDAIVHSGLAAKFPRSRFFGQFDRTWADPSTPCKIDWVPGAFSIVRPAALKQVGLFDQRFFLYYEEVDLCRRLRLAGFSIWYWPDVTVIHLGGESSRKVKSVEFSSQAAQVIRWRMRSTLIYYRKHHGWKARAAKWSEQGLYWITVGRNRFSKDPQRRARGEYHRTLIRLMNHAWHDTNGGRTSPPSPW